ncbi:IS3 family transposase [Rhodoferax sp.]|uniref:IS3 family transposase n=1 Tax=Rhodoferax sp. TaxID=50421 RepID=UPI002ACDB551|nr:IS3 family transposase [Rhodoferax sp.]MDZ7920054.1 IS3 family transposase [Rhodoferax sp.]
MGETKRRAKYTLEYKMEAVRLVKGGQAVSVTAKILGIPKASLDNWVRLSTKGQLKGAGDKPVSPEQMELARLRAELARVKMERDIPKKSDGVLCKGISVKYAWIASFKTRWPITLVCDVLGVSASGYFENVRRKMLDKPAKPAKPGASGRMSDERLLVEIRAIHAEVRKEYGWPKMWKELVARGHRVGKERVRRLMQKHGIRARCKRKFVVTTDSKHHLPIAPDLLQRNFTPSAPNQVWTGDITYIATDEGWLYLAAVIDLFSRQVVGWSMQPHMQSSLVTDALKMAWFRRNPAPGLIFHSDRGSQYCGHEFQDTLKGYKMNSSMSRKGNCWDNAPTESLWGRLKVGRLYGQKFATRREAMDEVIDWLTFYNHRRLHSTLGYVSPMQFEKSWDAAQLLKAA